MWVIKVNDRFNQYVGQSFLDGWEATSVRDNAKRFSSKQEAKDFMAKHSITGSIIPA